MRNNRPVVGCLPSKRLPAPTARSLGAAAAQEPTREARDHIQLGWSPWLRFSLRADAWSVSQFSRFFAFFLTV